MTKKMPLARRLIKQRRKASTLSKTSFLHIFGLWGIAVVQPLFDLFARYGDFFVAHEAQPADVVLLAGLLSVGLPLLLVLLIFVVGSISHQAKAAVHHVLLGALMMLFVLWILKGLQIQSDILLIVLAALLSTAFLYSYVLIPLVRDAMTWLAITVVVFPIIFLTLSPVKQLIFPSQVASYSTQMGKQDIPIVFIIFEEIPLVSLLDENHVIDSQRYPNFSQLSQTAHWFRNYTVNAPSTSLSVSSILTGKYAIKDHLMVAASYPYSMFSILAPHYRVAAEGLSKGIVPVELKISPTEPSRRAMVGQLSMMLLDMSVVYLHMILPSHIASNLPPVTDNWNHFFVSSNLPDPSSSKEAKEKNNTNRFSGKWYPGKSKKQDFDAFIASITNQPKLTLYYLHAGIAHNPWLLAPSGRWYGPISVLGFRRDGAYVNSLFGFGGKRWSSDKWLVNQGYQRHLFEVSRADAMVGEVMSRLKSLDMFEQSLIVITSDHGASFKPGSRTRGTPATAPGDTMPVPFIIKLPYQKEGVTSDANAEAIDVLPTIADILDMELPAPVDGQSMFDTSMPKRDTKTMVYSAQSGKLEQLVVSATNDIKYERLQNKLAIFGSGHTRPNGYYAIGPFASLVGRKPGDIPILDNEGESLTIEFKQRDVFKQVDIGSTNFIPIYVSGTVLKGAPANKKVNLAIAVNGTVQAVTQTFSEEPGVTPSFYAMLPEHVLVNGSNKIDFYAIVRGDDNRNYLSLAVQNHD
jgi:hypothetical protein